MVWRGMPVRSPSRGFGDSPVDGMLADVEPQVSSPVLVGRSGQLSALDSRPGRAVRGSPSAVMIGGEAGVGKSRLVSEFADRSRGAGARVLIGGCLELGADGLPFAPFTAVLRELVRDLGAAGVAGPAARRRGQGAGPAAAGVRRARRARRRRRSAGAAVRAGAPPAGAPGRSRSGGAGHRGHALGRPVQPRPAGLPDPQPALHRWHADRGDLPVRRHCTARTRCARCWPNLTGSAGSPGWISAGSPGQDTGQLVAQITGREPDDDLLAAVYRRTEGNPLFVEALLADGEPGSGAAGVAA